MELATTLSAISTAKDFAALIIGRKIDAAVTEKAIDLQNSIIAFQSGLLEMQAQIQVLSQEKRDLQAVIESADKWQAEEEGHQLASIAKGVYVMLPKIALGNIRSSPWYCHNCWQKRFKSVLQFSTKDYGGTLYYCPNCDAKIYDHSDPA